MRSSPNKKKKETERTPVQLSPKQRRIFLIVTLIFPFVLVIFLEIGLRISGYGNEYALVIKTTVNGKEYYTINPGVGKRYFDPARYFVPQIYSGNFEIAKSQNTFRVFVLGESTPAGFPYQYNATPTRILQKQLEIIFPEKNIEVINAGLTGTNSYTVLDFIDELVHYQPDAFIVYSGQNEFYGAFGAASTNSIGSERWLIRLYQSLRRFRSFILLENSFSVVSRTLFSSHSSAYSGTLMQQLAKDKAISIKSESYRNALINFEKNLTRVVQTAKDNNVPIIISTLVTNESGLSPFVSLHDASLGNEQKKKNEGMLESAVLLQQQKKFSEASELLKRIAVIDPTWAIAQFRLGQWYEQKGLYDSALTAYGNARDDDGLRFRASSEYNNMIRRSAPIQNFHIADVESTFRVHSPNGIIGSSLMWEHVHPTFTGYVYLSKTWLESLKQSKVFTDQEQMQFQRSIQDSVLVQRLKITALDLEIGSITMSGLLRRWPFTTEEYHETAPTNNVQFVAQQFVKGKLRWNEAHYEMADAYLSENDPFDALNEYESVAAFYPNDPFPLMRIGDLFSGLKQFEQAEKAYIQSLALQENSAIRLKLGIIYLKAQFYEKAVEQLQLAMNGKTQSSVRLSGEQFEDAQFYYAVALSKSGKTEEAKTILTSMLQRDPNNGRAIRLSQEIELFQKKQK